MSSDMDGCRLVIDWVCVCKCGGVHATRRKRYCASGDQLRVYMWMPRHKTYKSYCLTISRTTTSSASTQPAACANGTRTASRGRACSSTMQRASSTCMSSGNVICDWRSAIDRGGSIRRLGGGAWARCGVSAGNLWPAPSDTHTCKAKQTNPPLECQDV